MGIGSTGTELATRYTSADFTAAGAGRGMYCRGGFNVSVWGTFVATVVMERSFDGGMTYVPVAFSDGTTFSYSAPMSGTWSESEAGVLYRLRCSAFTSGTVNWRLSL